MSNLISLDTFDSEYSDRVVEQLLCEYDDKLMSLPDIELQPHLLISKVRKHYMEYLIQLLSVNYEKNQRLLNKNIYLPSAIWRCAKSIELAAAQACMVVQLYRQNIVTVIKELKKDTKKGKLNKQLYDYLRKPPGNEKKIQVSLGYPDQCMCSKRKKACRSASPHANNEKNISVLEKSVRQLQQENDSLQKTLAMDVTTPATTQAQIVPPPMTANPQGISTFAPNSSVRESQDSDDLMMQLEKLFKGDGEDEDIFDAGYCYMLDTANVDDFNMKLQDKVEEPHSVVAPVLTQDSMLETHAAQIKSLDERLASLSGILANNTELNNTPKKPHISSQKKHSSSKWLCEEYFSKTKLYELLDEVRETNRKKYTRIKRLFIDLFGEDSDDEGVVSPLVETPEFVLSCKERIAPWVVKLLTPSYIKGRIRGKTLFKAVAKHLIRLIYQCSKYPQEYEVQSFVSDFLNTHRMIRCEADFKEFRIENI